jgi:hypothetical protein
MFYSIIQEKTRNRVDAKPPKESQLKGKKAK